MQNTDSIGNPALGDTLKSWLADKPEPGEFFLQKIIPNFVTLAFVIAAIIFVFTFILGAVQWIGSGGDKAQVEGARGKITNAIIGIVLLFAVYAIIRIVEAFFGTDILKLDIGILKIQ
jgi:hypothetical protein